MAKSILEKYTNRLDLAERLYSQSHGGRKLTESKKMFIAACLENAQEYCNQHPLTEAFGANSTGTQMINMGEFSKFTLNLINVTVPTLIATDIAMTYPMSDRTGYIEYVSYTAGSTKGRTQQGKLINNPFQLGDVDVDYTSSRVVDDYDLTEETTSFTLTWKPVIKGSVTITTEDTTYVDNGDGAIIAVPEGGKVSRRTVTTQTVGQGYGAREEGIEPYVETIVTKADGTVVEGTAGTVDYATGAIELSDGVTGKVTVRSVYDNAAIPANDLPVLNAEIKGIDLHAEPRRIAIYYSQLASYQSKKDFGLDLGSKLAEMAVAELAYEVDTEVCDTVIKAARVEPNLFWSKRAPVGVSIAEHYDSFSEIIENAKVHIYNRTRKYTPNFMIISMNIVPVLQYCRGFRAASNSSFTGPYFCGEYQGIKVFVTPNIAPGKFVLGVNDGDLGSSAVVYAPYMPICPTQLVGYADGGMSQGFSTMYDIKLLNPNLLVAGQVLEKDQTIG